MELSGKIIQKLDVESGVSKNGNEWKKQSIVIETPGNYPKKVCFSVWGDRINEVNAEVGDTVSAQIDIESREYNGRWYTDVKAWQIQKADGTSKDEYNQEPDVSSFSSDEGDEDLPF